MEPGGIRGGGFREDDGVTPEWVLVFPTVTGVLPRLTSSTSSYLYVTVLYPLSLFLTPVTYGDS